LRGYEAYPLVSATDDADAGAQYQTNLQAAARNPWCVGVAWFEYRDEPVSGRGFLGETDLDLVEGEDYAFGMVDVADRPKYDLVNQVRTTNLAMAQRRLAFAPPSLNTGGTVNNASFAANTPVAPGSLVSIFGTGLSDANQTASGVPLPTALGTTSLTLGGVPSAADPRIPDCRWTRRSPGNWLDKLRRNSPSSPTISAATPSACRSRQFSPGIYTATGTGAGQGAILINGTSTLAAPASAVQRGPACPARHGLHRHLRHGARAGDESAGHRRARAVGPARADHQRL
jgi:hypothetical protein